jgi:hypothetical protein
VALPVIATGTIVAALFLITQTIVKMERQKAEFRIGLIQSLASKTER